MQFGICTSPRAIAQPDDSMTVAIEKLRHFAQVSNADFVEFGVNNVQAEGDVDEWHLLRDALNAKSVNVPTWNCFLPAHHRVTGSEIDHERVLEYCRVVLGRVREAGGEIVVLGSGRARQVPDQFSRHEARNQFIAFCQKLGPIAQEANVVIALEPLNTREDNLINTIEQGAQIVDEIAHSHIQLLADQYHIDENGENYATVASSSTRLRHAHTADLGRKAPGLSDNGETRFVEFFRNLRESGYANRSDARIAIECNWSDFASEAAPALALLRQKFKEIA